MQVVLKLTQPEYHPKASDLIENGEIRIKVVNGEKSPVAIGKEIGLAVVERCMKIIKKHQPDLVHVFTHAGEIVPEEGDAGIFQKGRGGYFSALSKVARVDHYAQVVVPVITAPGLIAFETEAVATQGLNEHLPFIKDVDLSKYDFKEPVMANNALRNGSYFADTKVFVGFGFGLGRSMTEGLIIQNPKGPVIVLLDHSLLILLDHSLLAGDRSNCKEAAQEAQEAQEDIC